MVRNKINQWRKKTKWDLVKYLKFKKCTGPKPILPKYLILLPHNFIISVLYLKKMWLINFIAFSFQWWEMVHDDEWSFIVRTGSEQILKGGIISNSSYIGVHIYYCKKINKNKESEKSNSWSCGPVLMSCWLSFFHHST